MTSLADLFSKALTSAAKGYNLPTVEESTQELFASALRDLTTVNTLISDLSLHSSNETLEDISTRSLVYLLVPYVTAEVRARTSIPDPEERIAHLLRTQQYLRTYVSNLQQFEIVTVEERELFDKSPSTVPVMQRRELKIRQYKKEKELRTKVETIRKRRHQSISTTTAPSDFDLIASILPSGAGEDDDDDDESDDILREATLLLLRLMYTQARNQLDSTEQEFELLRSAISQQRSAPNDDQPDDGRTKEKQDSDIWKLDRPDPSTGPLLDPKGRVCEPYT
jgi:immunoglobulin-binding protein 1